MNDIEKEQEAFLIMKRLYLYAGKDWTVNSWEELVNPVRGKWQLKYDDYLWIYVYLKNDWINYTTKNNNGHRYFFTNTFLKRMEQDAE